MQDLFLLKCTAVEPLAALREALPRLVVWQAVEGGLVHAIAPGATPPDVLAFCAPIPRWIRLQALIERAGASAGETARFHYVVETDVATGHEADFTAWYDTEHLPGLAAVPGTVRAARYRAAAGSPRYYACYDLAATETVGSPPWLAVRGTAWSDRVRPTFRNTRRTMFRSA